MERIHSTFGFIVHNLSLYNAPLKKEKKKKKLLNRFFWEYVVVSTENASFSKFSLDVCV